MSRIRGLFGRSLPVLTRPDITAFLDRVRESRARADEEFRQSSSNVRLLRQMAEPPFEADMFPRDDQGEEVAG